MHLIDRPNPFGAGARAARSVLVLLSLTTCLPAEHELRPDADLVVVSDLVIGGSDEGPESFSDIRAIGIDASGRIFIADEDDAQVRVFDSAGGLVRRLGRRGRGPGEFSGLRGISVSDAGEVSVYDPLLRRVTVFDSSGVVTRTHQIPISSWGFEWDGGIDPSGRLVDSQLRARPDSGFEMRIRVLNLSDGTAEWFAYPTCGIEPEPEIVHAFGIAGVPFAAGRTTRIDPQWGGTWCAHSGRAAAYFVPFGQSVPSDTFLSDAVPARVSAEERSAAIANLERQVPQLSASGFDRRRIPDVKPMLRAFASDERGRLWLELWDEAGTVYHLFSPTGHWIARVRLNAESARGTQFKVRADRLYIISHDSLGVPSVMRFRPKLPLD